MNEDLKTLLSELGIKPVGISKMEADGITDEETLQNRLNELRTIDACKKDGGWVISKGAFAKLIDKFPLSEPAAPAAPDAFGALAAPLCKTTKLDASELAAKLADLGDPDELVEYFTDGTVTLDLLIQLFGASADKLMQAKLEQGLKKINQALEAAKPAPADPAPAPTAAAPGAAPAAGTAPAANIMLLSAPGDDDLLRALKLGGRPEFEPENIAAVIRAAVAQRGGLFALPNTLVKAIRDEARAQRKPNPPILIQVRRELNRRSDVAAIFADLLPEEQSATAYVTADDKKECLAALDSMWPAFIGYQKRLRAFRAEAFQTMMTGGLMANMAGGNAMMAMQGLDPAILMGATLATDTYVDDSEGMIEALNGVFMDQGLYASRVLGAESARLLKILKMPGLVTAVGATNFDDMLRKLGIGVTSDVVRAQNNLVAWAVNVIDLPNKDSASLPGVLLSLCNLGEQIPWDRLSGGAAHLSRDEGLASSLHGLSGLPKPERRDPPPRRRGRGEQF